MPLAEPRHRQLLIAGVSGEHLALLESWASDGSRLRCLTCLVEEPSSCHLELWEVVLWSRLDRSYGDRRWCRAL